MPDNDLESGGRAELTADPRRRRTGWMLVVAQFALLVALVALPVRADLRLPVPVVVLGVLLVVVGLAVVVLAALNLGRGLTASPLPNAAAQLRTDGAYRWARHPIYGGILLGAAGVAVASGSVARLVIFVALIALLRVKARWEERWLRDRFPGYAAYAAMTPRFLPRLSRGARRAG